MFHNSPKVASLIEHYEYLSSGRSSNRSSLSPSQNRNSSDKSKKMAPFQISSRLRQNLMGSPSRSSMGCSSIHSSPQYAEDYDAIAEAFFPSSASSLSNIGTASSSPCNNSSPFIAAAADSFSVSSSCSHSVTPNIENQKKNASSRNPVTSKLKFDDADDDDDDDDKENNVMKSSVVLSRNVLNNISSAEVSRNLEEESDYEPSDNEEDDAAGIINNSTNRKPGRSKNLALNELWDTEQNYLKNMRLFVQAQQQQQQQQQHEGPKPSGKDSLFSLGKRVLAFHEELQREQAAGLGPFFSRHSVADWVRVYAPFCALATKLARMDPATSSTAFAPVQRLPRYPMLLDAVAKHAHRQQQQADKETVLLAVEMSTKMARVAHLVDEHVRTVCERERVAEVAAMFSKRQLGDFVMPWRRFLREGSVYTCEPLTLQMDVDDMDDVDDDVDANVDTNGRADVESDEELDLVRFPAGTRLSVFLFNDCVLASVRSSAGRRHQHQQQHQQMHQQKQQKQEKKKQTIGGTGLAVVRKFLLADTWILCQSARPTLVYLVDHVGMLALDCRSELAAAHWVEAFGLAIDRQTKNSAQAQQDRQNHQVTATGLRCPPDCRWRLSNGLPRTPALSRPTHPPPNHHHHHHHHLHHAPPSHLLQHHQPPQQHHAKLKAMKNLLTFSATKKKKKNKK